MKIKELLEFNPEADIEIIMPNCLPFNGNIDLGWSHSESDSLDNRKETASEVCIILGNFKETIKN